MESRYISVKRTPAKRRSYRLTWSDGGKRIRERLYVQPQVTRTLDYVNVSATYREAVEAVCAEYPGLRGRTWAQHGIVGIKVLIAMCKVEHDNNRRLYAFATGMWEGEARWKTK